MDWAEGGSERIDGPHHPMTRRFSLTLWPRITIGFFLLLLLAGCDSSSSPGTEDNQRIPGPFEITRDWQVIPFDPPLVVNRKGYQRLHFVVDEELYMPNGDHDIADMANHFNLRRNDGKLIKPEVILIAADGQEVAVSPASNTSLYEGGLTISFAMYAEHSVASPLFPEGINTFTAVKVRSNEPFTAEHLRWWLDRPFPEGTPEPTGKPAMP